MMTMLEPQSSPYTVPKLLKWILVTLCLLFILSLSLAVWMYAAINDDRKSGHPEAIEVAREKSGMNIVEQVSTYHGELKVHIVQGATEEVDNLFVFIDLKNDEILAEVPSRDILSPKEMKAQWQQNCASCIFKDVQYAYEENEPVYQFTYIDEQNRYVLDYFTLTGDSFDQRFAFKQK